MRKLEISGSSCLWLAAKKGRARISSDCRALSAAPAVAQGK